MVDPEGVLGLNESPLEQELFYLWTESQSGYKLFSDKQEKFKDMYFQS